MVDPFKNYNDSVVERSVFKKHKDGIARGF